MGKINRGIAVILIVQLVLGPWEIAWSQAPGGQGGGGTNVAPGAKAGKGGGAAPGKGGGAAQGGLGVMSQAPVEEALPGGQALSRAVSPGQYILGPGDGLLITIWGEYDDKYDLRISPDGKVSIPTIGTLVLKGISLTEAETLVGAEVKRYYRNVKSTLSLTSLRVFEVLVLGEVEKPGRYLGTPVKRVSDAVTQAGGVTSGGSQRYVQVRRAGEGPVTADLIAFLRRGDELVNPYLHDGDVIFVPPLASTRVTVYITEVAPGVGGVMTETSVPSLVEVREGERLTSLFSAVGGVSPWWDMEGILVQRVSHAPEGIMRIPVDLRRYYVEKDESQNVVLQDGDQIYIPASVRRVLVAGAVGKSGGYPYFPGKSADAYVAQAGGALLVADFGRSIIRRADGTVEAYSGATELNNGDSVILLEKTFKTYQDYFALVGTATGVILSMVGFYAAFTNFGR